MATHKFPIGTVVRHTSTFLRSIGSYKGNSVNGVVVALAKGLNFPVVMWSNGGAPTPVNPANLEVHKAGEAQMTPGIRAAVVAEGAAKYQKALDRQAAEDAAYFASPEYAAYKEKRGILRSSLNNPSKGFMGAKKKRNLAWVRCSGSGVAYEAAGNLGTYRIVKKPNGDYTLWLGTKWLGGGITLGRAKQNAAVHDAWHGGGRSPLPNPQYTASFVAPDTKAVVKLFSGSKFTDIHMKKLSNPRANPTLMWARQGDAWVAPVNGGRFVVQPSYLTRGPKAKTHAFSIMWFGPGKADILNEIRIGYAATAEAAMAKAGKARVESARRNPYTVDEQGRKKRISQKALREHIHQHHAKLDAEYRAKEAAARAVAATKAFRWSAPNGYTDTAGYRFLRSLEGSSYARDVAPYLKVTEDRVTLSVPPSVGGRVRYGVHEGFAGSTHPQAWKPRNAFDAWADLTGGLDADGRE
jgi:hypothetical protein